MRRLGSDLQVYHIYIYTCIYIYIYRSISISTSIFTCRISIRIATAFADGRSSEAASRVVGGAGVVAGVAGSGVACVDATAGVGVCAAPCVKGPGVKGLGVKGPGVNGIGVHGIGVHGPGVNAPGVNGIGVHGIGVHGPGVNAPGVNAPGEDELGVNELGVKELGVNGPGVNGPGDAGPGGPSWWVVKIPEGNCQWVSLARGDPHAHPSGIHPETPPVSGRCRHPSDIHPETPPVSGRCWHPSGIHPETPPVSGRCWRGRRGENCVGRLSGAGATPTLLRSRSNSVGRVNPCSAHAGACRTQRSPERSSWLIRVSLVLAPLSNPCSAHAGACRTPGTPPRYCSAALVAPTRYCSAAPSRYCTSGRAPPRYCSAAWGPHWRSVRRGKPTSELCSPRSSLTSSLPGRSSRRASSALAPPSNPCSAHAGACRTPGTLGRNS